MKQVPVNRFDRDAKVAYLSKIFDWYEKDFGGGETGLLAYVRQYVADPGLAAALDAGGWRVEYLTYDWSLNGVAPPAS